MRFLEGPLLTMTGITKQYPGTLANDHVSLTDRTQSDPRAARRERRRQKHAGQDHIRRAPSPDEGEIVWQGRDASPSPIPVHAQPPRCRHGVPALLAVRGADRRPRTSRSRLERPRRSASGLRERIVEHLHRVWPAARSRTASVHDLSVGERQRIEIVRCLLQNPKLLIMDEPTSVLTPAGGAAAVRDPAAAGAPRAARSSTSATSWRRCGRCARAATIMRLGKNVARLRAGGEDRVKEAGRDHDQRRSGAAPTPRPLRRAAKRRRGWSLAIA